MAGLTFEQTVPSPSYAAPPPLDFSKLVPDYQQGVLFGQQQQVRNAFQNGVPTTDGTPNGPIDYQAMSRTLAKFGDFSDANTMMQTAISQQGLKNTSDFNSYLRTGQMPGADSSAPAAPASALPPTLQSAPAGSAPIANNAPGPQGDFYSNNHVAEGSVTDPTYSNGTATGVTQITQPTWDTLRAAHPEANLPPTVGQASADQQRQAENLFVQNATGILAQNGIPVNDRNVRMTYFLGTAGGTKFLNAISRDPGAAAAPMFPAEADNNPSVFYNVDPSTGKAGPGGGSRSLWQVMQQQTAGFGQGNTTGFNPPVTPRNQVAGPVGGAYADAGAVQWKDPATGQIITAPKGTPIPANALVPPGSTAGAGGPLAFANDGTPVQTNASGQAIDPRTGQPTQVISPTGVPRANVHITNQPTVTMTTPVYDGNGNLIPQGGQAVPVTPAQSTAVAPLANALGVWAARGGGTSPGGAATQTGGAAAANAAQVAATTPSAAPGSTGQNVGALSPIGPPGSGASAPAAQGNAPLPPSQRASYAENLSNPPPSNPNSRGPGGAAPTSAPALPPPPPTGRMPPPPPQAPAPMQTSAGAPAAPVTRPLTSGSSIDPTLGGLVPKPFADGLIARGTDPSQVPGAWARYLTSMASSPGTPAASADSYRQAAQQVMETLRQANVPNPALKEYEATRQIDPSTGQPETQAAWKARTAAAVAGAEQNARNENTLVETQPVPGGPKQYDTAAHLIRAINNGTAGPNSSFQAGAGSPPGGGGVPSGLPVAEQPAWIADRQKEIATDETQMLAHMQNRQVAQERLGELANLTEQFQTGSSAEFKANAQAFAKAWGINIPNSATTNAALYQEITKNAIANVFSNAKDLGGRILVTELAGLTKANVNAELQPAAAAKIISQGAGILNYENAHDQAYFNWKRNGNQNAYDTSGFEIPFLKANPVSKYTDEAAKQIAPLGGSLPPAPQRQVGQVYQSPNGLGVGRWTGIPGREWQLEKTPAAQRLFPVTVTP